MHPNHKPTIEYDFANTGVRLAEELPRRAVLALYEANLPTNKLQSELRAYLRAKPVGTTRPRQILQIVTRYVNVQPTHFIDLEKAVGSEAARRFLPDARIIPSVTWESLDYLDHVNLLIHANYRNELEHMINSMTASPKDYYEVAFRWMKTAGVTLQDVRRFRDERRTRNSNRAVPA